MTAALMGRLPLPVSYVMTTVTMVVHVNWTQRQIYQSVCEYPALCRSLKYLCADYIKIAMYASVFLVSLGCIMCWLHSYIAVLLLAISVTQYFVYLFAIYVLKGITNIF